MCQCEEETDVARTHAGWQMIGENVTQYKADWHECVPFSHPTPYPC